MESQDARRTAVSNARQRTHDQHRRRIRHGHVRPLAAATGMQLVENDEFETLGILDHGLIELVLPRSNSDAQAHHRLRSRPSSIPRAVQSSDAPSQSLPQAVSLADCRSRVRLRLRSFREDREAPFRPAGREEPLRAMRTEDRLLRWAPGSRRKRRAVRFHVTPHESSARCRDGSPPFASVLSDAIGTA